LLDVNVLLALVDPLHVFNQVAQDWFAGHATGGWATCPLTENGLVRILSYPRYPNRLGDVAAVLELLRQMCSLEGHRFWPDELSIRDVLGAGAVVTPSQITDLYLLGLAAHNGGKLATLDRRLPAAAIRGGPEALELIAS
jgi:toxin-antitoxin system PIN domain toxin